MKKAKEDLTVAEDELDKITWASTFHSQQTAEKALKALLIALGKRPPKTHRIELLIELVRISGVETRELQEQGLEKLSNYAVEARYPDFEEEPSEEEAEEALRLARKVLEWVTERLKEMGIKC